MKLAAKDDQGTVFGHLDVPDNTPPKEIERLGLEAYLTFEAKKLKLDPALAHGLIASESDFKPDAVGPPTKTGERAYGIAQLMPKTAAAHGVDPRNPYASIRAGLAELQQRLVKYGDPDVAIASYKGWDVDAHGGVVPPYKAAQQQVQAFRQRMEAWQAQQPRPTLPTAPGTSPPAAGAPAPAESPAPAPSDNLLGQAGSSIAETGAGLLDLPTTLGHAVFRALGVPFTQTTPLAETLAPHLAAPPQTETGRVVRAATGPAVLGAPAGVGSAVLGAATGVGSLYGGDIAEGAGVPRAVGEVVGGLAPAGIATAGRIGLAAVRGSRAATRAAEEAATLAEQAAQDASAKVAQTTERTAAHVAKTERIAAEQSAVAGTQIEGALMRMPAEERAGLLRAALQKEEGAFVANRRALYDRFMTTHGDRPVSLANLHLSASDLTDRLTATGLSPDAATQQASRILAMGSEDTLPLRDADALRSELGRLFRKATGPTKERAASMFKVFDQSVDAALPPKVNEELQGLRQVYRSELRMYRNGLVRRILDDTEQGRAAAERYTTGLLTGSWSPAKAQQVKTLLESAGTNTTAHEVVKDAVLRQALQKATRVVDGVERRDWGLFARTLRNPDGLNPAFRAVVRDPREQARVLQFADEADRAMQRASEAAAAAKTEVAATKAAGRLSVQTARRAAREAAARAPAPLSVLDVVLAGEGFQFGGLKGAVAAPLVRHLFRWMRSGTNRAILREASRTAADSTTGQRLLESLTVIASRVRQESGALGPLPVAADQPSQVQNTR